MSQSVEIISLVLQQDLPITTLVNPNGTKTLNYTIDVEGTSISIIQAERPTATPPDVVPKGTELNILLAPPLEDQDPAHRRAIGSQMSKTGTCPECGRQDTDIGAVFAEPDWWACMDCIVKELTKPTN